MTITLVDIYEGIHIRDGALDFLFEIMKERELEPHINISHRGLPTFEHHRAFWSRRPYRCAYIVAQLEYTGEGRAPLPRWAGYVSATMRNEIGIVLRQAYRGRGLGPMAVKAMLDRHKPLAAVPGEVTGRWIANIAPGNVGSQGMFSALGFREIQRTYELPEEETNGSNETGKKAG